MRQISSRTRASSAMAASFSSIHATRGRMSMPDPMLVFDRAVVRRRRERAARGWDDAAFLKREIATRLVDRLDDIKRDFPLALDIGCHGGEVGTALALPEG